MIQLRIIGAVEQMNGTWARCRKTHSDLTGELGVSTRHQRGHFLVPDLDEVDQIARPDQIHRRSH
jgi:hypothetical protein